MIPLDRQFYISIGVILRKQRLKLNMSLQEVVDKLSEENKITKQTLNKYEFGKRRISKDVYNELCKILQLSPSEVLNSIKYKED